MTETNHWLWITDPWETLDHSNDTTLRLMQESLKCGLRTYWCDLHSIEYHSESKTSPVRVRCKELRAVSDARDFHSFIFDSENLIPYDFFEFIQYRVDPPINEYYLLPLNLLSRGQEFDEVGRVFNPLSVLMQSSEKILPTLLRDLQPDSIVTKRLTEAQEFLKRHHKIVLKPLNQAQSKGVQVLSDMAELESAFQASHSTLLLLQEWIATPDGGETRLWFAAGELVATVRKLPRSGQSIINMDQGSFLTSHSLTDKELAIVPRVSRVLKDQRIQMAAIDLMNERITDFNFTSPGLVVAMERVLNQNIAATILDRLIAGSQI